ncbi:ubiquinone biosynthesis protein COQ9, mitochondrial [Teleopsis dalmanni]|uniref:ubiquinone biosynthesis protein COQ9, mitochondrial n=1 Tax=Teleopsis dalmanni TaxID=139649 RepID=UPI0018CFE9E2|nr:ubiquinone biosynthesis protein COQ9, mitochondrial [Teleopsis dalmanni]
MSNLGVLNKIVKLQKLLLPLSAHNFLLASSSYATQFLHNNNNNKKNNTFTGCSRHATQNNRSRTYTTTNEKTINDFREREEQREREFIKQQEKIEEEYTKKDSNPDEEAKKAKVDAIRTKILEASLVHVPALGWSRNAIVKGAEDSGFPGVIHGMFPEGGFALVSYYNGICNDELAQRMAEETENGTKEVKNPLEFLVRAVRTRMEMIIVYKAQWPQALALIALPQNASTALAQVLTLVDDICYYSGDRSVDFDWYTRRIGLATIMKMTELYMLQDTSPQHENTWEFLKNRMDEAVQLQMMLSQTGDMTNNFQRSFNSAFITARNILGLNYDRR